ncbi:unnamed protein product, partial [Musa acuminata subsp. burmannicoides]
IPVAGNKRVLIEGSRDNSLRLQKNMTIHQCTFVLGLLCCRSWRFLPFREHV